MCAVRVLCLATMRTEYFVQSYMLPSRLTSFAKTGFAAPPQFSCWNPHAFFLFLFASRTLVFWIYTNPCQGSACILGTLASQRP